MKYRIMKGWQGRLRLMIIAMGMGFLFQSCIPEKSPLGMGIFPSSDSIFVYTDTIFDIDVNLVRSHPRVTSLDGSTAQEDDLFLLGSSIDTISGISKAEIITQMSLARADTNIFGRDPFLDETSVKLSLYFSDVIGDTTNEMHLLVYEFLESIYYDSVYYSDYDVSDKYDPDPLVDEILIPKVGQLYYFDITNQDFIERLFDAARGDNVFTADSVFQKQFHGLYITTQQVTEGGSIAKVQMANNFSGITFDYLHDSVYVDTVDSDDYSLYFINFHEYKSQKINIFHNDFSGTFLGSVIDNPETSPVIGYAQGMAGVNLRLSINGLDKMIADGMYAINGANLLFYVVPDSLSGISVEDYPEYLMLETVLNDGTYRYLYDYYINSDADFGKLQKSHKVNAFADPLYYYNFSIGRHLQAIMDGEDNSDLFIFVSEPETTNKIIKFWSDHSYHEGGIRLELIYSKF